MKVEATQLRDAGVREAVNLGGGPVATVQALAAAPASPPLRRFLIAADLVVVLTGWLAAGIVLQFAPEPLTSVELAARSVLLLGAAPFLLSGNGLYRRRICAVRSAEIARLGRTSLLLAAITLLLSVGSDFRLAVLGAVTGLVVWFALFTAERGVFREWIQARRATGDFGAPVVVVGGESTSIRRTAEFLGDNPFLGFRVLGLVGPSTMALDTSPFPWLTTLNSLANDRHLWDVSGVVLDASSLTGEQLNEAVELFTSENLHVHISSGLRGIDRRRITLSPLADETFLHIAPSALRRSQVVAKRVVDVCLASLALLLLGPLIALSALVIWMQDRGPVLYRQERVGLEGERFTLFKLRTMVTDAEQRSVALQDENVRGGPLFKLSSDPRVTPFGRFLRVTSIDEIPQLFNVLEGTMSLVGPRPALPAEVAQFDTRLTTRLTVKPGMTGLWQVEARDLPSFDLYRRFDLMYVQNWSLALDLAIIGRTVVVVLLRGVNLLLPTRLRRSPVLE